MLITLRPIAKSDLDFLWRLHVEALCEYVEKTWGWVEEIQKTFVKDLADRGDGEVIVVDGVDAGVWFIIEYESEVLLNSIRLLPEFQNRGIGTRMIRELIEGTDKPVRLQVLKVNPARSLYERLGFKVFAESDTHYKMICRTDA